MNFASRKMALLEQKLQEQEERDRIDGVYYSSYDKDLQVRVSNYMSRVRSIY